MRGVPGSEARCLMVCPYLSLADVVHVGPWALIPLSDFDDLWPDRMFEIRARQLLDRYRDQQGEKLKNVTIIKRSLASAIENNVPSEVELGALQLAIDLGTIAGNPKWGHQNFGEGSTVLTSDNSEIHCWPIHSQDGYVAFGIDGIVRTSGLWSLDHDGWIIPSPIEVPQIDRAFFDDSLATAAYETALRSSSSNERRSQDSRIVTAIRWWSKAWRNTPSIRNEDRIVLMKTAFEALSGTSDNEKCARFLIRAYKRSHGSSTSAPQQVTDHLLWSSSEDCVWVRTWTNRRGHQCSKHVTALEHWFLDFADLRNQIIHEGSARKSLYYDEDESAYAGPFLYVADRVFREVVAILLSTEERPRLWCDPLGRAALTMPKDVW